MVSTHSLLHVPPTAHKASVVSFEAFQCPRCGQTSLKERDFEVTTCNGAPQTTVLSYDVDKLVSISTTTITYTGHEILTRSSGNAKDPAKKLIVPTQEDTDPLLPENPSTCKVCT